MSNAPSPWQAELRRWQRWSLVVGAAALILCVIGGLFSPDQFFRAYLAGYLFWLGIPLGCLALLMLYHVTGGAWGFLIRRILEAGMRTLPLLAILFLPIAFGVEYIYLWARPGVVLIHQDVQRFYLNAPFFWVRAALFFILWIVLASFLSSWSRQQDQSGSPRRLRKFALLSAPGLITYGVTITFAAVDWVMSLQPGFRSTIFGPLFAAGQLLSALAFALIVLARLAERPPLADVIVPDTVNDLGSLLFTFLILWTYMAFFQFMLIWIANLPEEVIWYLPRSRDGWQWVAWALVIFHFVVPFFLLLMRDIKRDPRALAGTAGLILFMQLVFNYYQVMPAFSETRISEHWLDFLTPIGVGGLWLAYFFQQLLNRPLVPEYDLNREEALRLRQRGLEEAAREEVLHHG